MLIGACNPMCARCTSLGLPPITDSDRISDRVSDPNARTNEGSTPLHMCARRAFGGGGALTELLLGNGAELVASIDRAIDASLTAPVANRFGATALHVAAGACGTSGSPSVVTALLRHASAGDGFLAAQDHDGLAAIHFAARLASSDGANHTNGMQILRDLVKAGADVSQLDYSDATPLVFAAYEPASTAQLQCVTLLLAAGSDPTIENEFGWSPLHVACSKGNGRLAVLLRKHASAPYLATFDPEKPRDLSSKKYTTHRGGHNRIPLGVRKSVLRNDHGVGGIAGWLQRRVSAADAGTAPRPQIVVMTGAGISTNAGIPDFRSPKTGMYSHPRFRTAFDAAGFQQDPSALWTLATDVFGGVRDGSIAPTPAHCFLRLLHKKGLLLRNYTQNIDGLEVAAGVPDDLVVEAHGTIRTAHCVLCGHRPAMAQLWHELLVNRRATLAGAADDAASAIADTTPDAVSATPTCSRCGPGAPYRPDVVMFGESLPTRFTACQHDDVASCDLLIVMGTSLVVYPFAGLANQVGPVVPRLLLNNTLTGPFQLLEQADNATGGDIGGSAAFRDAAHIDDCDSGVNALCDALGWRAELDSIVLGCRNP